MFFLFQLKLSTLELDDHARDKFLRLVGDRYNPKTDVLTIVTDRCPMKKQNYDYCMYVLTALFHESWVSKLFHGVGVYFGNYSEATTIIKKLSFVFNLTL
jgi:Mitochondrial ribosomal subunit protein.